MSKKANSQSMRRALPSRARSTQDIEQASSLEQPRAVRNTVVDFSSLPLPREVRLLLAEAFWNHVGIQKERSIHTNWFYIKTFGRFVEETSAVKDLNDFNSIMLSRFVEWLNQQSRSDGQPWSKSGRAGPYAALRGLLLWIERCRPNLIPTIIYPNNPFPWRNRDTPSRAKLPAHEIRAILRACEKDIAEIRKKRENAKKCRMLDADMPGTYGWLLNFIDQNCNGIAPPNKQLVRPGWHPVKTAFVKYGGLQEVEIGLYPGLGVLIPYYLALLIHTAGNPDPIAELRRDCLQPIPLMDDREALIWFKARANSEQRLIFNSKDEFEPPALIKEIVGWSEVLIPHAPAKLRDRLFIYRSIFGVTTLSSSAVKGMLKNFCTRHGLKRFSLASIRPGVLSSFYRVKGDLKQVGSIANHANLSTTVRYVNSSQVVVENHQRVSELQDAFLGQIKKQGKMIQLSVKKSKKADEINKVQAVSMFGFDCKNPYEGLAAGTKRGELCSKYMGCFTCPNAVISPEPAMLARLLQARDHLRSAASLIHPIRWQSIYAPQLRILVEDILPQFSIDELAAAEAFKSQLGPLPELR